jgi:DNA-binding transcriptional LysR family regulator
MEMYGVKRPGDFRAVVEAGGVTRAAERLHRVQSNITTRIRQLEEKLGTPLFIREGKRLHLSPAGQVLLDYAQRLLALADEARDAVRDGTPRGALVLGAMESTSAVRLPGPLSDFVRLYPEVKLALKTGNPQQLAAAVLAGTMDAALVTGLIADGPFEREPIYSEELVIVASAGHAAITAKARSRRAASSPLSRAARTAPGWSSGTPAKTAGRCRPLKSPPTTRCWAAWWWAWAFRWCRSACWRPFPSARA